MKLLRRAADQLEDKKAIKVENELRALKRIQARKAARAVSQALDRLAARANAKKRIQARENAKKVITISHLTKALEAAGTLTGLQMIQKSIREKQDDDKKEELGGTEVPMGKKRRRRENAKRIRAETEAALVKACETIDSILSTAEAQRQKKKREMPLRTHKRLHGRQRIKAVREHKTPSRKKPLNKLWTKQLRDTNTKTSELVALKVLLEMFRKHIEADGKRKAKKEKRKAAREAAREETKKETKKKTRKEIKKEMTMKRLKKKLKAEKKECREHIKQERELSNRIEQERKRVKAERKETREEKREEKEEAWRELRALKMKFLRLESKHLKQKKLREKEVARAMKQKKLREKEFIAISHLIKALEAAGTLTGLQMIQKSIREKQDDDKKEELGGTEVPMGKKRRRRENAKRIRAETEKKQEKKEEKKEEHPYDVLMELVKNMTQSPNDVLKQDDTQNAKTKKEETPEETMTDDQVACSDEALKRTRLQRKAKQSIQARETNAYVRQETPDMKMKLRRIEKALLKTEFKNASTIKQAFEAEQKLRRKWPTITPPNMHDAKQRAIGKRAAEQAAASIFSKEQTERAEAKRRSTWFGSATWIIKSCLDWTTSTIMYLTKSRLTKALEAAGTLKGLQLVQTSLKKKQALEALEDLNDMHAKVTERLEARANAKKKETEDSTMRQVVLEKFRKIVQTTTKHPYDVLKELPKSLTQDDTENAKKDVRKKPSFIENVYGTVLQLNAEANKELKTKFKKKTKKPMSLNVMLEQLRQETAKLRESSQTPKNRRQSRWEQTFGNFLQDMDKHDKSSPHEGEEINEAPEDLTKKSEDLANCLQEPYIATASLEASTPAPADSGNLSLLP
eukprot:GHVQ01019073.1.p1 GENE.GHVQ01019073.1~~GHVQ01019073.1.p1  ORF type:complete len:880 (+),score=161.04 GHVQ01019073.1:65-2641(+)